MKVFFEYHNNKYNLELEDKIKLLFQATKGINHLTSSVEDIEKEITGITNEPLYEYICDDYVRMNINPYFYTYNEVHSLFNMFSNSVRRQMPLEMYANRYGLSIDESIKMCSHSNNYKEKYNPHYRLVSTDNLTIDLRVKQLELFIKSLKDNSIISIEGKCGSGKTTITSFLKDVTVIHVDDFFLERKRKTEFRLEQVGGNIDYELIKENLVKIKKAISNKKEEVIIKCYDCQKDTYYNKNILLKRVIILEGVYSYHQEFLEMIDKVVFVYVSKENQTERILKRPMKDKFFNEWIPLEEKYYEERKIDHFCDLII